MRLIAAAVLVALLLPAAAMMTLGERGGCCCTIGPGASCPMKRTTTKCDTPEVASCGMKSGAPATRMTLAGIQRPALLMRFFTARVPRVALRFDAPDALFATRARHAPDAPPPKFA